MTARSVAPSPTELHHGTGRKHTQELHHGTGKETHHGTPPRNHPRNTGDGCNKKETKVTKRFGLLAGVVSLKDPLFFSVEYLNSKERYPLFFRFNIITSDDYLDYLNLNKTINNEERKIKRNH